MSKIDFTWHTTPPPAADVYATRRGTSKYLTHRYWDGERWWQIEWNSPNRYTTPFKWPKGSRTQFPGGHLSRYRDTMGLRRINDPFQSHIQWGAAFRVYDEKEVLAHLVSIGTLPADWRTAYQDQMRARDRRDVRA